MKKTLALVALLACAPIAIADNHAQPTDPCMGSPSCAMQVSAWDALGGERYEEVLEITDECTGEFGDIARETDSSMSGYADAKNEMAYWVEYGVLTDVAACYFIRGEALMKLDRPDEALVAYTVLVEELQYSQLWDPRGWFWKPAEAAGERIAEIGGG